MPHFLTDVALLAGVVLLLVLLSALLSPFETLGWWAGWDRRWPGPVAAPDAPPAPPSERATAATRYYLVYLSGIGSFGPKLLIEKELNFLDLLQRRLPGAVIVRDIYPYSPTNDPLPGRRYLAPFWRLVHRLMEASGVTLLVLIISVRNLFQVAISADRRYGPLFNFGVAREIALALVRHGYRLGDRQPVVLMGLSGAAQIAVGATPVLKRLLRAPVWLVSIGGVLTDDPGILAVEHVLQVSGSRDPVQHVGAWLYPGRWRVFNRSAWNRALARGKLTVVDVGPVRHMAQGDYFSRSSRLPNGQSHVEKTVAVIGEYVEGLAPRA